MVALYGSVRPQLGESDWSVTASNGGSTTTGGTLTFFLQARNRAGRNLLSVGKTVTWTAGQQVMVTINASARQSGEDIFSFILSASTSTPQQARQLAEWRAKNTNQFLDRTLPANINLNASELLLLAPSVANLAALPTTRVNGMIRQVEADFYKWDSEATEGTVQAGSGYWVQVPRAATFLSSTESEGGSDQSAQSDNPEVILPPPYNGDGSISTPVRYWLINGLSEDTGPSWPVGTLIGLATILNGQPTTVLNEKARIKVLGKVRRSTGILESLPESNAVFVNSGDFVFSLSEEIDRGYGIAIEISLSFVLAELTSFIPVDATVNIYPFLRRQVGIFNPFGEFFGDTVTQGDKWRILPDTLGFIRSSGVGQVQSYITPFLNAETFFLGLAADTSQKVCVSAALGGVCTIRENPLSSEAIRAIVSTQSGETTASNWTTAITITSGEILQATLTFPSQIRANYPDVIAGMAAKFNCPQARIYFRIGGIIYRRNQPITLSGQSVSFTIMDLLDTTVVSSLPTSPSPDFNFWDYNPITTSLSSGSGVLSGSIEIAIAYFYPSPNSRLTKISHSPELGCLSEFSASSFGGGGAAPYKHTQTIAASTWVINHNLGFFPTIQVFNADNVEIEGQVTQVSPNQATVSFLGNLTGYALAN